MRGFRVFECFDRADLPRPNGSPSRSWRTSGQESRSFVSGTDAYLPAAAEPKHFAIDLSGAGHAGGIAVDVDAAVADEAAQRHASIARQLDRERGRRPDRDEDRTA